MYRDLNPDIFRQRLVIEGLYSENINAEMLKGYIEKLSKVIKMTIIYGPIVKNLAGKVFPHHAGFECQAIWAESGLSVYTWTNKKFFTVDIYTCKKFDVKDAVNFTKDYFKCKDIVWKEV